MPSLLIRNVDPALHSRLKRRAAAHHHSLEEEVRQLLHLAVASQPREEHIVDLASRLFGPRHGADLDIPSRGSLPQRPAPDFSDFDPDQ